MWVFYGAPHGGVFFVFLHGAAQAAVLGGSLGLVTAALDRERS